MHGLADAGLAVDIVELASTDLPRVAEIHCASFPKSSLTALGRETVRRYYLWQMEGPHRNYALGIRKSGFLVGYCFCGVFEGAMSGFIGSNMRYLIWRVITQPWLIANPLFRERLKRGTRIAAKAASDQQPARKKQRPFIVLAIAVDPNYQGYGAGKRLMEEVERLAIAAGFSSIRLSVDVGNEQAVQFYERLGWTKHSTTTGRWEGHMERTLNRGGA